MPIPNFLIYSLTLILGLLVGSFLNVIIRRLPLGEGFVRGSSYCPHCRHDLAAWQLIPLISYILLKGKCHYCQGPISKQYPLVEAANGLLWLIIIIGWGFNAQAIIGCLLSSTLLVLAIIDGQTGIIPPQLNLFIGLLGLIRLLFMPDNWFDYALAALILGGALLLIFIISKGRLIGGGDIKLMAACGLLLGLRLSLLAFFMACILGSAIHLLRIKFTQADRSLAFGPYLAAGILISYLGGEMIITWYLTLILN